MKSEKQILAALASEEKRKKEARKMLDEALDDGRYGEAFELLVALTSVEGQRAILKMILNG